jgi:hypothetical protein
MPSVEWLRDRFFIDPDGQLRHNKTIGRSTKGAVAGRVQRDGYRKVDVMHEGKRKKLSVHRIVCSMKDGVPVADHLHVDHKNRNRDANKPRNLRAVTPRQNMLNRCCAGKGVTRSGKKWRSKISVMGKTIDLGTYVLKSEAKKAFKLALRGDHPKTALLIKGQDIGRSETAVSCGALDGLGQEANGNGRHVDVVWHHDDDCRAAA